MKHISIEVPRTKTKVITLVTQKKKKKKSWKANEVLMSKLTEARENASDPTAFLLI